MKSYLLLYSNYLDEGVNLLSQGPSNSKFFPGHRPSLNLINFIPKFQAILMRIILFYLNFLFISSKVIAIFLPNLQAIPICTKDLLCFTHKRAIKTDKLDFGFEFRPIPQIFT